MSPEFTEWPEISENLMPGQTAQERPDLCSRVFNMKVKEFMEDIVKREIFGTVAGIVCGFLCDLSEV